MIKNKIHLCLVINQIMGHLYSILIWANKKHKIKMIKKLKFKHLGKLKNNKNLLKIKIQYKLRLLYLHRQILLQECKINKVF